MKEYNIGENGRHATGIIRIKKILDCINILRRFEITCCLGYVLFILFLIISQFSTQQNQRYKLVHWEYRRRRRNSRIRALTYSQRTENRDNRQL